MADKRMVPTQLSDNLNQGAAFTQEDFNKQYLIFKKLLDGKQFINTEQAYSTREQRETRQVYSNSKSIPRSNLERVRKRIRFDDPESQVNIAFTPKDREELLHEINRLWMQEEKMKAEMATMQRQLTFMGKEVSGLKHTIARFIRTPEHRQPDPVLCRPYTRPPTQPDRDAISNPLFWNIYPSQLVNNCITKCNVDNCCTNLLTLPVSEKELREMKEESKKATIYAKKLAYRMFTLNEFHGANVYGRQTKLTGCKKCLNPAKVTKIEDLVFEHFPMDMEEINKYNMNPYKEKQIYWHKCVDAINSANRHLWTRFSNMTLPRKPISK